MSTELAGQVAVVTGGGRGIGAAIAQRLATMGATTVTSGRQQEQLRKTAKAISGLGGKCEPIVCDVTDLKSVENFAQQLQQKFGRPGHSGEQCRHRRIWRSASQTSSGTMGRHPEHEPARRLVLHAGVCSCND